MGNAAAEDTSKRWLIPFGATIFAMLVMQMSNLGSSPLLKEMQREFKLSESLYGTFTGMYGISALLLSVPGGLLAKRFGEKRVLATGLLFVAMGLAALSLVWSTPTLFTGRAIYLLGYRPAFVCVMTAIAIAAPLSLRSRSMGIVGAVTALGTAVGAPFGSSIGARFGWRNGILAFAGIVLLAAIIFFLFYNVQSKPKTLGVSHTPDKPQPKVQPSEPKSGSVFRNPIVWALAVLEGIVGLGYFSGNFFIPGAVEKVFQLKDMTASYIISTGFVVAVCSNIFFGYLMDRYNKWNVMALMMVILIPASLCMTSTSLPVFWVGSCLVLAVGLSAAQQCFALAAELVTGREMGNVMGVVSLGPGIFGYIGPQTIGWLRDWSGAYNAGWCFLAIVAAVSLIIVIYIKRYVRLRIAVA